MGARTLFPEFTCNGNDCTITAPPNAHISPPGWFQLFVLDGPTPSFSQWVRIGGDPAELGKQSHFRRQEHISDQQYRKLARLPRLYPSGRLSGFRLLNHLIPRQFSLTLLSPPTAFCAVVLIPFLFLSGLCSCLA